MAEIYIHPSLVRFTDNQKTLELAISTIEELIPALCAKFPKLKANLLDDSGELTPFVNCYINGKNLRSYDPKSLIMPDAKAEIVTALVGG
ncbi:MoaD family protein [Legionella massiliensis]|uniref:MoaD family protein n=1 Tax=Legionella massiliensis TaxID=1034943 RepID=A0A078KXC0_9GAMM|nr:hypothetical protein [Legionella massiliensis]CDZ77626.1 MoaD family protein [Legionella massiliensis]CEE13364.1 hypothetical protein BN1094_01910 [Legionella massiliensis]